MPRYPYYLETDDAAGEVRLMQDSVVVAHSKSRNQMAKIRDALNAPTPLEGAYVRREKKYQGVVSVGVVQAVAPGEAGGFKLLMLMPDGTFETWLTRESDATITRVDKPYLNGLNVNGQPFRWCKIDDFIPAEVMERYREIEASRRTLATRREHR